MCGICGVLDLKGHGVPDADPERMSRALLHRGPDDHGVFASGPLKFGFRRLSIIDVAGGRQPMSNAERTVWIIFNGEIYNHVELRPFLKQRGYRYSTNSDTETILHLYEEYGENCVDHLRGMFAFAIWDQPRRKLFCARDRLGIKPFYYTVANSRFAFASEIKALLELQDVNPQLNRRALPEFLSFGYLSMEETLFSGIQKLLPGHRLVIDLGRGDRSPQITQYWNLDISTWEPELQESEYVDGFDDLFTETVRMHLRSDVPVGVFLSGGLDSSSIAAVMATLRKDPIQTFSVGYAEDEYSETSYARQMAQHIGAQHHEAIVGPDDFFHSLPQVIWHEDEPLVWPSSVALFHVAQLARESVKVVLTGEGADEILAGYLKYRVTLWNLRGGPLYRRYVPGWLQQLVQRCLVSGIVPDWLQRKLRHSFLFHSDTFEEMYFDNFYSAFSQTQQTEMFTDQLAEELGEVTPYTNSMKFFSGNRDKTDWLNRLLYLDIKTYLVELLMKQDQMSMAASLESRVPFLDHKLVEFAARVPARLKTRLFSSKYLLRRAMASRLPSPILRRSKKGFPTPIRPWLRDPLFGKLQKILTDGRLAGRNLIRPDYVERLLIAHQQGSSAATEGCWRLLNFELWSRIFLDGDRHRLELPSISCADALAHC
jgi:asparagine synthase (glutamine-hydrolysing)